MPVDKTYCLFEAIKLIPKQVFLNLLSSKIQLTPIDCLFSIYFSIVIDYKNSRYKIHMIT